MFHCRLSPTLSTSWEVEAIVYCCFSLSLRPSNAGVHSPSCPLGPGATSQGLKCIVAAANSSTDAGCTLGEVAGLSPSPAPSTERVPMSWSRWDRGLPHKSGLQSHWCWHTLGSPLPRACSTREEPAFVTEHSKPHCASLQGHSGALVVLMCYEGAPRLGIVYGRHRVLDSRAQLCIFAGFRPGCAIRLTLWQQVRRGGAPKVGCVLIQPGNPNLPLTSTAGKRSTGN